VPPLYLVGAAGDRRMRLLGFEKIALAPGASGQVTITAEPRLLARYDGEGGQWHISPGNYEVAVGRAADGLVLTASTTLTERRFGR
jgi:beta-glucosidase